MLQKLEPDLQPGGELSTRRGNYWRDYIDFLTTYADIGYRSGDKKKANIHLLAASSLRSDGAGAANWGKPETMSFLKARYQWWRQNGEQGLDDFNLSQALESASKTAYQSCLASDVAARTDWVNGEKDKAAYKVGYLRARGYAEPDFIRFCTENGLCGG